MALLAPIRLALECGRHRDIKHSKVSKVQACTARHGNHKSHLAGRFGVRAAQVFDLWILFYLKKKKKNPVHTRFTHPPCHFDCKYQKLLSISKEGNSFLPESLDMQN
jgi:hypothetical protein